MTEMTTPSRSGWDWLLGGLLVISGLILLGHTVLATAVSVLFIAWLTLAAGIASVVMSFFMIGKDGFWLGLLGGGLLTALGFVMLRNPGAAAVTLTLIAATMFMTVGIARIAVGASVPELRVPLLLSGGVSLLLALMVLFNLYTFSFTLLGVLLGVQVLVEGIAVLIYGRQVAAVAAL